MPETKFVGLPVFFEFLASKMQPARSVSGSGQV
jgi:hypothetical protein